MAVSGLIFRRIKRNNQITHVHTHTRTHVHAHTYTHAQAVNNASIRVGFVQQTSPRRQTHRHRRHSSGTISAVTCEERARVGTGGTHRVPGELRVSASVFSHHARHRYYVILVAPLVAVSLTSAFVTTKYPTENIKLQAIKHTIYL